MVTVKLYVEGAGKTDLERQQCRQAFSTFFGAPGLLPVKRPRTIPCGGRKSAYDAFVAAVKTAKHDDVPLLLVDAEDAVQPGHTVWQHLKSRDDWGKPVGANDDQAFLMVQIMETWFLADRDMLRAYFGDAFSEKHLRAWPSLEDVPKAKVYEALAKATAQCKTKTYSKGRISFEMLGKLNPVKVEKACPHAKALLERLRSL